MVSKKASSDTSKTDGSKRKVLPRFVLKFPTQQVALDVSLKELSAVMVALNFTKMEIV
jgi:hypothetical protein